MLSQLSYSPAPGTTPRRTLILEGLDGFEPSTPALSRRCSNQLSYRPVSGPAGNTAAGHGDNRCIATDKCEHRNNRVVPRKEVIQPHLPIRLPCYDFTPVMNPTVVSGPLAVSIPTSGRTHSHGVTGGVYKTRERIHRGMLIRDY